MSTSEIQRPEKEVLEEITNYVHELGYAPSDSIDMDEFFERRLLDYAYLVLELASIVGTEKALEITEQFFVTAGQKGDTRYYLNDRSVVKRIILAHAVGERLESNDPSHHSISERIRAQTVRAFSKR
jgi:hypothetical protein